MDNREIDQLIETHFFNGCHLKKVTPEECTEIAGDHVADELWFDNDGNWLAFIPKYSENIHFAWTLINKLTHGKVETSFKLENFYNGYWASFEINQGIYQSGQQKSAPLAICIAALKIPGIEVNTR